jgi:hypothetical protein
VLDEVIEGYSNTDYLFNYFKFLEFLRLCHNLTDIDLSNQDIGDNFVKELATKLSDDQFCPHLS